VRRGGIAAEDGERPTAERRQRCEQRGRGGTKARRRVTRAEPEKLWGTSDAEGMSRAYDWGLKGPAPDGGRKKGGYVEAADTGPESGAKRRAVLVWRERLRHGALRQGWFRDDTCAWRPGRGLGP